MFKLLKSWPVILVMIGIGVLGAAPPAQAQFLDMVIAPPGGGSVSFAGAPAPLVGSGIQVDFLVAVGAFPGGDAAPHTITSGILSFTTGAFTGVVGPLWTWGAGGSITVTGGIPDFGIPATTATGAPTVLLSGSFTSATVVNTGTTFLVDVSVFVDDKHPGIEAFYFPGVDPSLITWGGVLNLSFQIPAPVATGAPFASNAIGSGDIQNTPNVIPEPTSIALLGMGAVSLAGYSWRRVKARRAAA